MNEILVRFGGLYMVSLVIFHLLFWRIFNWPRALSRLNPIDRSTLQVLNISITLLFAMFAYISFVYTNELLTTSLGKMLLVLIAIFWLLRAAQQLFFYDMRHPASIGLTLYFLLGAGLYGIPGAA